MASSSNGCALEYLGTWCEIEGHEGHRVRAFRPLLDSLSMIIGVRNTGETTIDHFTWRQTVSIGHMKVELLHPRIPSQVWKPFAGNLLSSTFIRHVVIADGLPEVSNPVLGRRIQSVGKIMAGTGGVEPGCAFEFCEASKPYVEFMREGAEMKCSEMKVNVRMEVEDGEKGLLNMIIPEYKFGPITFHDMKMQMVMKGRISTLHEVFIDDKLCDTKTLEFEYL